MNLEAGSPSVVSAVSQVHLHKLHHFFSMTPLFVFSKITPVLKLLLYISGKSHLQHEPPSKTRLLITTLLTPVDVTATLRHLNISRF